MTRRHTPIEQYRQAQQIAHDHNLLICPRAAQGNGELQYVLYRKTAARPIYLGRASGTNGLYRLVIKFAH